MICNKKEWGILDDVQWIVIFRTKPKKRFTVMNLAECQNFTK